MEKPKCVAEQKPSFKNSVECPKFEGGIPEVEEGPAMAEYAGSWAAENMSLLKILHRVVEVKETVEPDPEIASYNENINI